MIRYRPKGAVSIFLSCILLTLIVFSCTIVDVTRIHIAKIQAERALQLACESILASYDSQLQSQYGIFAKDFSSEETILNDLSRYTNSALNPSTISTTSNTFYSFFNPITPGFSFYDFKVHTKGVSKATYLVNADSFRQQVLDYMKYRAPYTALEPFLDKLGIIKKAAKTSEVIEQKDAVIAEIKALEVGFYDLEMLIDGIMIEGTYGTLIIESDGVPAIYPNYLKKLYTKDSFNLPIYTQAEVPMQIYCDRLNQNLWFVDDTLKACQTAIAESGAIFNRLVISNKCIQEFQQQIEANQQSISYVQQQIDILTMTSKKQKASLALTQLQGVLNQLVNEGAALSSEKAAALMSYDADIKAFNERDALIYEEYVPKLQQISGEYRSMESIYGLKGMTQEALLQIELIKSKTPEVVTSIKDLKSVLANEGDIYIDSTCKGIQSEIENYEKLLGINEAGSMDVVDNFTAMAATLGKNLQTIETIEGDLLALSGSRGRLHTYWYAQNQQILNTCDKEDLLSELHFTYDANLSTTSNVETEILGQLVTIEANLDNYSRDMLFDYGATDVALPEAFNYEDFVKMAEGMFPGISLPKLNLLLTEENLPSKLMAVEENPSYELGSTIDLDLSSKCLGSLDDLGKNLVDNLVELKDELYFNEYVMGMFRSATDHLKDETGKPKVSLTLSHFPKSAHYLNYEIEYILFGDSLDETNLLETVAVIYAIRIALNLIALISDVEKMNSIKGIASAVAGWWSLGIGTIVVTTILTLVWR